MDLALLGLSNSRISCKCVRVKTRLASRFGNLKYILHVKIYALFWIKNSITFNKTIEIKPNDNVSAVATTFIGGKVTRKNSIAQDVKDE